MMRSAAFFVLLLPATATVAQVKSDPAEKAFRLVGKMAGEATANLDDIDSSIDPIPKRIETIRAATIDRKQRDPLRIVVAGGPWSFSSERFRAREASQVKAELDELSKKLETAGKPLRPHFRSLSVPPKDGEIGVPDKLSIAAIQVLDTKRAIVRVQWSRTIPRTNSRGELSGFEQEHLSRTFLLSDFPTAGIVDGDAVNTTIPLEVGGTYRYSAAGGGTRTIPVIFAFDDKPLRAELEKQQPEINRRVAASRARIERLKAATADLLAFTDKAMKEESDKARQSDAERIADAKLAFAKAIFADKAKRDKGIEKLNGIVKDHPGTKAAVEAAELLKTLK